MKGSSSIKYETKYRIMKAKEKAQELINKMKRSLYSDEIFDAKRCALVAVNEIINSRPTITDSQVDYNNYWNDVKSELESF